MANDVSPEGGVFGGNRNSVHLITKAQVQSWPEMTKDEVAERLMTGRRLIFARRYGCAS